MVGSAVVELVVESAAAVAVGSVAAVVDPLAVVIAVGSTATHLFLGTTTLGPADVHSKAFYCDQTEHSSCKLVEAVVDASPQPELSRWPKTAHESLYSFFLVLLPLLSLSVVLLLLLFPELLLSPSASFLPLVFSSLLSAVVDEVAVVAECLVQNVVVGGETVGSSLAE